jgi:hypothetical protein
LGLQESDFDWDDEDMPLHQILQPESEAQARIREETPPNTLPAPTTTSIVTPVPVTTPITPGAPSDPQSASATQSAAQDAAQGVTQGAAQDAAQSEEMPQSSPPQPPQNTVQHPSKTFQEHKTALAQIESDNNLEEQSDDIEGDEDFAIAIEETLKYFNENPDLGARYSNPDAIVKGCLCCNKNLAKSVFDVYQHCATEKTKHVLMHRGVAAAIKALYGDQDPPRSQAAQRPREETRPNRSSSASRARNRG